jgi:acetyltransferase-like isoleucine patch superfamily enzyme
MSLHHAVYGAGVGHVMLGTGCSISAKAELGWLPPGAKSPPATLDILLGDNVVIEPFAQVYAGSRIGSGSIIMSGAVIYPGAEIGENCRITHGAVIRDHVTLRNKVSIGNNSIVLPHATLEDEVSVHALCLIAEYSLLLRGAWLGPGVKLYNTRYPKAPGCAPHKELCDKAGGPVIGADARIGGNTVINPFVKVGDGAVVGSGSVVLEDIPARTVYAGNPAHRVKNVDELTCTFDTPHNPY